MRVKVNGAGSVVWLMTVMALNIIRRPFEKEQQSNTIVSKFHVSKEKALLFCVSAGMFLFPAALLITGFPRFADFGDLGLLPVVFGSVVTVAALYLFWRSHADLGRNWSPTTELREDHTLTTSGVYSKVRHPMYTSLWIINAVQPLLVHNWIAGFAPVCSFTVLYFIRIEYEEEMMIQQFGDEYLEYCRRTKRLVPGCL